eukprot:764578-Hanusia_phi.AAC.2
MQFAGNVNVVTTIGDGHAGVAAAEDGYRNSNPIRWGHVVGQRAGAMACSGHKERMAGAGGAGEAGGAGKKTDEHDQEGVLEQAKMLRMEAEVLARQRQGNVELLQNEVGPAQRSRRRLTWRQMSLMRKSFREKLGE